MQKKMTLKAIRAMFAVGQQWEADNTYNEDANGTRTLTEMHTTQFVWKTPQIERSWMNFPKASQIIEAVDGRLTFQIFDQPEKAHHILTLRRLPAAA